MLANAGTQYTSMPLAATYPRAIAIAFTAWLTARGPITWISAEPVSRIPFAIAPAAADGSEKDDTFKT